MTLPLRYVLLFDVKETVSRDFLPQFFVKTFYYFQVYQDNKYYWKSLEAYAVRTIPAQSQYYETSNAKIY